MASISETDKKCAMDELKQRLKQHMDPEMLEDETFLHRFLKVRKFDVDLAETMLKNHLEWRKKNDVDNILKFKQPEVLEKYYPFPVLGYDKEGCVVRYTPSGNIDWIGINFSTKIEDLTKRVIYDLEYDLQSLKKQSQKIGKTVHKVVYIHNLENLSFAQATDKNAVLNLVTLIDLYHKNYPETLKNVYVINAVSYFSFIFALLKKFLPSSIISKFKVYSDDSWKKDLLEVIDADVLPAFLGGTRTDPDGNSLCKTFINHGGSVPESYFIHKSKRSLSSSPGVQKVTLSNAAFHEVKLEVKEAGSYLEWEFETASRDIGFGLFRQQVINGEESNDELISIQRIKTDEYAETGLFFCEKEGTYVMVFDNTYSWVRAKEIFYKVKILGPGEQNI